MGLWCCHQPDDIHQSPVGVAHDALPLERNQRRNKNMKTPIDLTQQERYDIRIARHIKSPYEPSHFRKHNGPKILSKV